LLILGVLAVAACAESSPPPDAEGVRVINLEPYFRGLRSVTVTVLGEPRRFLFDTGGGQTIISPALAEEAGCDPYGRSVGFRMSGERVDFETCAEFRLQIGDYATGPRPVVVWDVGAVLPGELPPLDGVISLKSFDDELITLDLAQSQITVETGQSFQHRTAAMSPLPMQVATGQSGSGIVVYVGADVGGRRLWLQFDTGNIEGVQLSPDVVELFGVSLSEGQQETLESQGAVSVDSISMIIPGLGSIPISAVIRPLVIDGALSFDFIERWVFSLDLRSHRLWAGPRD